MFLTRKFFLISLMIILACSIMHIASARTYGKYLCKNNEDYVCYRVKRGDSWQRLFPNEEERDLVKRINRKNIRLRRGVVIAIPKSSVEMDYYKLAPFPLHVDSEGKKLIIFDPAKLAWAAYDAAGNLVRWGPASGGNTWCADVRRSCRTARGNFAIYYKKGRGCKSGKYPLNKGGGAPMPYCMYFYRGFAFHGSPIVPGYNASHGCVRLFTEDAKWLNENFVAIRRSAEKVQVKVLPYSKHYKQHSPENKYSY